MQIYAFIHCEFFLAKSNLRIKIKIRFLHVQEQHIFIAIRLILEAPSGLTPAHMKMNVLRGNKMFFFSFVSGGLFPEKRWNRFAD
jgi:hypothetical protein